MSSNLRQLLPFYVIVLIWNISWTASVNGPVMPLYVESAGIGIIGWSLLVASFGVGMLLLEWVWGAFYDRFDRRLLMMLSVLCMTVLYPLFTLKRGSVSGYSRISLGCTWALRWVPTTKHSCRTLFFYSTPRGRGL